MKTTDFLGGAESFRNLNPHLFGQANQMADRISNPAWECAESERRLHEQILEICGRNRWLAFRDRMDLPTTGNLGRPDFIIARRGDVLFVECKTRTGKLSNAQLAVQAWLESLGHRLHVVRSVGEFEEVAR